MPGFESIIGQHLPVRLLQLFIRSAKIPHALLFTGIEGIGKRTTARLFAQALNCSGIPGAATPAGPGTGPRPCGGCRSCRQIEDRSHPDVIELAPRKGMLRIDQIRDLINVLALKPFGAAHRVVILADAHQMNQEAGNALLKVLEEPPAGTIIILTALQRTDLLPTIASRCRHIRFNPLGADDLTDLLRKHNGMPGEQAHMLARIADGSYSRAVRLAETQWTDQRNWVVRAAGLDRTDGAPGRTAAQALAFSAQLALRKAQIDTDLELLKSWIRDLGVCRYQPGHIIHRDREAVLRAVRDHIREVQLVRLWETVEKAQRTLASNGNLRLTLDVMALQMAGVMAAENGVASPGGW